jgi:Mu transposase-like protein
LPTEPYVFAEWRVRRVGIDYHVDVEGHFYSVPYRFARSEVEVRLTSRTVEIFVKGERIAVHLRSSGNGKHTTAADHMPSSHRRCNSACKIDPAYCLICECYQGGGDATLSDAQVDVWVTGGPVGGSGPS